MGNHDLVAGSTRPVPLDFSYVFTGVHETIEELLKSGKAPVYVVHFSQREASERAHDLRSEYCVKVTGVVEPRPEGSENPNLPSGEIEALRVLREG